MDIMSISTRSRSSSIFSLTSTGSSCTSPPTSPTSPSVSEKPPAAFTPLVLEWRPQLFSTAFACTRSTWLHFTYFPPRDISKSMFQHIGHDVAISMMHRDVQAGILGLFATPECTITPTCEIPIPSNLPSELVQCLKSDIWDYYTIHGAASLPIGIGNITSSYKQHIALRKVWNGVERYIFGPGGLSIHSVCRIKDKGTTIDEDVPRETLYIEETTEVLCSKVFKWWFESQVSKWTAEAHENLRRQWEESFLAEWDLVRHQEKVDLLA